MSQYLTLYPGDGLWIAFRISASPSA